MAALDRFLPDRAATHCQTKPEPTHIPNFSDYPLLFLKESKRIALMHPYALMPNRIVNIYF